MIQERPRIGKYILDSLSIGMYNHPLALIREYIQNSTDAIDEYHRIHDPRKYEPLIDIRINGETRSMKFRDNGSGIRAENAWHVLHDLGNSNKELGRDRGFRGIGRLGGLGYCTRLIFRTKYEQEALVTTSSWDCNRLRELMRTTSHPDSRDVLTEIIEFNRVPYDGDKSDHFFEVEMLGLSSSRDILLNIPLIRRYVSEVAPVPFAYRTFAFADEIDRELRSTVHGYETYRIVINGEPIFKPYSDQILLRGGHKDRIEGINFFTLSANDRNLGFGWIADMQLLGTLSAYSGTDGLRVRKENILVGDKNLLSGFFRENRFNHYLAGEIHITDVHLVPNSRRDDFEDNAYKDDFYESFIKIIGLPISRRIRQQSLDRAKNRADSSGQNIIEQARKIQSEGHYAESQKSLIIRKLNQLRKTGNAIGENIDELIHGVHASKHVLDKNGNRKNRIILKPIFEILFQENEDKGHAIRIIRKILGTRSRAFSRPPHLL